MSDTILVKNLSPEELDRFLTFNHLSFVIRAKCVQTNEYYTFGIWPCTIRELVRGLVNNAGRMSIPKGATIVVHDQWGEQLDENDETRLYMKYKGHIHEVGTVDEELCLLDGIDPHIVFYVSYTN